MKAQSALEYLTIIAIVFVIIVPTVYLFYSYSRQSMEQSVYSQVGEIGRALLNNAKSVYYSGEHSKVVIEAYLPDNIQDTYLLYNRELVFEIEAGSGDNEMIFFSDINLTSGSCDSGRCNLSDLASSGTKKIKLEAQENGGLLQINISRAS